MDRVQSAFHRKLKETKREEAVDVARSLDAQLRRMIAAKVQRKQLIEQSLQSEEDDTQVYMSRVANMGPVDQAYTPPADNRKDPNAYWLKKLKESKSAKQWNKARKNGENRHDLILKGIDFTNATEFADCVWWGKNGTADVNSETDFAGPNFAGFDFSGFNMMDCKFKNADFTNCVLRGAELDRSTFDNCLFAIQRHDEENLEHGQLPLLHHNTDFWRCLFRNCNFDNVRGERLGFYQAEFIDSRLFGCQYRDGFNDGAKFKNTVIRSCVFEKSKFRDAVFSGDSKIARCDFREVYFARASFGDDFLASNTAFNRSSFSEAKMGRAIFNNCDFGDGFFDQCTFDSTKFSGCELTNGDWSDLDLSTVSFEKCDLTGSYFGRSAMEGTDFTGAKLSGAEFDGVRISKKGLIGKCADVRGAEDIVGNSILSRAIAKQEFPDTLRKEFQEVIDRHALAADDWYYNLKAPAEDAPFYRRKWYDLLMKTRAPITFMAVWHSSVDRLFSRYALGAGAIFGIIAFAFLFNHNPLWAFANPVLWIGGLLGATLFGVLNSTRPKMLLLRAWGLLDYGRDIDRMAAFAVLVVSFFSVCYGIAEPAEHIRFLTDFGQENAWYSPVLVAALSFATLGVGDYVEPITSLGAALVLGNVLSGFVTLGMFLAALTNVFSR